MTFVFKDTEYHKGNFGAWECNFAMESNCFKGGCSGGTRLVGI